MSLHTPGTCPKCGGPMPHLSSCQACGYLLGDDSNRLGTIVACAFLLFVGAVIFGNLIYPKLFPDPAPDERLKTIDKLVRDSGTRIDEGSGHHMILKEDWDAAMGRYQGVESGLTLVHRGWVYPCRSDAEGVRSVELLVDVDEAGDREWLLLKNVVVKVARSDPDDPGKVLFDYSVHSLAAPAERRR